jgi:MFS family permease
MLATLSQRNFALLWYAGLISNIGDWVMFVGLPIYIFLLTHSILATSLMMLVGRIPRILLGPVAGVFADRWDRKRILVVTNLLLTGVVLLLLLVRTPTLVWIVYLEGVIESSVDQFFMPAQNALLPTLVPHEQLVAANSLNSFSFELARLVGPALGGVVGATLGLNGIVALDSASFLIAAIMIALIAAPPHPSRPAAAPGDSLAAEEAGALVRVWRDWVDGLRVIVRERTLQVLLAAMAITSLGEGVIGVLYPVFVYRILHGGPGQIGALMTAQAIGGLIGGVLVGQIGARALSRWVIGLTSFAFGAIDLVIFNIPRVFPSFGLQIALFILVGIPVMFFITGMQTLAQLRSPNAYRGRISSSIGTTASVLGLIGTIIAGTITDHFGVVAVLTFQGAGYVVAGILMLSLLPPGRPSAAEVARAGAPGVEVPEPNADRVPSEV